MLRITSYLGISIFLLAACAIVGVLAGGEAGLAQYPRKTKLAPVQVAQPPFPYSLGIAAQGKRTIYVAGQVALDQKGALVGKDDPEAQRVRCSRT